MCGERTEGKTKAAEEYIPIYGFGSDGKPEKVEGQYTIYASRPDDEKYSPIWHQNYVIVPRDCNPADAALGSRRTQERLRGTFHGRVHQLTGPLRLACPAPREMTRPGRSRRTPAW